MQTHGLKERIKKAETDGEVLVLIKHGLMNFKEASAKTKRAWVRCAEKRRFELRGVKKCA